MKARYGLNFRGKLPGWRCYGTFLSTSETSACMANDGSLTNVECLDPDFVTKPFSICDRRDKMDAMIVNLRNTWASQQVTTTDAAVGTTTNSEDPGEFKHCNLFKLNKKRIFIVHF